jgi:hypothetical protein
LTDSAAYEDKVADFLKSLGYDAKVRHTVQGARAKHKIDVWVTFEIHGHKQRWVVECKYWKTNVDKEKVLVLRSVVEDVGATMGFIITETGFQPAAISATQLTNLELLTFAELKDGAREAPSDPLCRPFATLRLAAGETLPVELTGPQGAKIVIDALPDSGASECMLPLGLADVLGLNLGTGTPVATPAGSFQTFNTELDVRLASKYVPEVYKWRAPFVVSADMPALFPPTAGTHGVPLVLLGRRGFFDRFAVHLVVPFQTQMIAE